jgi:type II secretory pathway component PulL
MSKSIFIDVKEEEIVTYIFDIKQERYELKDTKRYPLSGKNDYQLDTINENIETAYVSLPLSVLNFRVIELPFSNKDRIREVLPFELDGIILGGSDRVVFDDIIIGSSDNRCQVLAVYVEKTFIREILEKLKTYNIDPLIITSLELRHTIKDFTIEKLLSPIHLQNEDRIAFAVEEIKKPSINLRRDEFAYTRDIERTKKTLRITAVLVILLIFVLSADLLLKIYSTRNEIASFKKEIRRTYQEVFPEEKNIINEIHQFKSHMKVLKEKEAYFVGINPLNLLLKLSQIDREGVVFNELVIDREILTMKGEASSLSNIQELKNKLEQFFVDVNISDSKASVQGKMLFTVTAKEKKI